MRAKECGKGDEVSIRKDYMFSKYHRGFDSVEEVNEHGGSERIFYTYFFVVVILNLYAFSYFGMFLCLYLVVMFFSYRITKNKIENCVFRDNSTMFYNGYNYVMIQSIPYSMMAVFLLINWCISLYYTINDRLCLFSGVGSVCNDEIFEIFIINWESYIGYEFQIYQLFVYYIVFHLFCLFLLLFVFLYVSFNNIKIITSMKPYERLSIIIVFIKSSMFFFICLFLIDLFIATGVYNSGSERDMISKIFIMSIGVGSVFSGALLFAYMSISSLFLLAISGFMGRFFCNGGRDD